VEARRGHGALRTRRQRGGGGGGGGSRECTDLTLANAIIDIDN
jgi:hypothetical protein